MLESLGLGSYLGEGAVSAPRGPPTEPGDLKGPLQLAFTPQEMLQSKRLLEDKQKTGWKEPHSGQDAG